MLQHFAMKRAHALLFCVVLLLAFLAWTTITYFCGLLKSTHRAQCQGRLANIACAVRSYHEFTQYFPPAFTRDQDGRLMHSWRVLVGAHQGGYTSPADYFTRYALHEAWNGPSNRKLLADWWGNYFACPGDSRAVRGRRTSYVAVVGEDTFWPGTAPRYLEMPEDYGAYPDYLSKILLIEIPHSKIEWMEPKDISVQEACALFLEEKRSTRNSRRHALHYVTAVGKVALLSSIASIEEFKDMLDVVTPAGSPE